MQRQIIAAFITSAADGTLRGMNVDESILPRIGARFFQEFWDVCIISIAFLFRGTDHVAQRNNPELAAKPPVGSSNGARPDTINGRIMEAFGSTKWAEPFLPIDAALNGAKGRVVGLSAATSKNKIITLARTAIREDTPASVTNLFDKVRLGFAVFEYINTPVGTSKWNLVLNQIATQLRYIGDVYNVPHLEVWWRTFSEDYFTWVEEEAQDWAREVIQATVVEYTNARVAGHHLSMADTVLATLHTWMTRVPEMVLPGSSSGLGSMPLPQPP